MRLHSTFFSALQHPSTWAGIAGVMSSTGTQIDKPVSLICYFLSALFSVIAILVKPPQDNEGNEP